MWCIMEAPMCQSSLAKQLTSFERRPHCWAFPVLSRTLVSLSQLALTKMFFVRGWLRSVGQNGSKVVMTWWNVSGFMVHSAIRCNQQYPWHRGFAVNIMYNVIAKHGSIRWCIRTFPVMWLWILSFNSACDSLSQILLLLGYSPLLTLCMTEHIATKITTANFSTVWCWTWSLAKCLYYARTHA